MSLGHGPTIVRDQLSLLLDVNNIKSYPGSGSSWKDLAQNINFSSYGTQTPLETVGGALCFDFNASGYWQSDSGHANVDMGGDCTLLMWLYCEDTTTRRTVFEKAGTTYQSYQQEIAVTWETSESLSYYSRQSPDYDTASTNALTLNAWNFVGIKMSTGKTATARTGFRSLNGSAWSASYNSRSTTALVAAGAVRVGSGYAGAVETGKVGMVMCYNKMLSDAEVKQNFDALQGRFGL